MAIVRSYSATFEQNSFAQAAVARYRFNEGAGTDAIDSADDLDVLSYGIARAIAELRELASAPETATAAVL